MALGHLALSEGLVAFWLAKKGVGLCLIHTKQDVTDILLCIESLILLLAMNKRHEVIWGFEALPLDPAVSKVQTRAYERVAS